MSVLKDLTGKTFGHLTVLYRVANDSKGRVRWLCRCDCGKKKIILSTCLKQGCSKSCGCQWNSGRKPKEIKEGTRFGKLTVLKSLGTRVLNYGEGYSTVRQYILCKCDCGKIKEISLSDLQGGVKTCGCGKRGRGASHE